jgi:hypothetical protein
MVTVRELARSQGFPDSFVFHSINDDVVTVRQPFCRPCRVFMPPILDAQANRKRGSLARFCCDRT